MAVKGFNYSQSLLDAKNGRQPQAPKPQQEQPSAPVPVNRDEIERQQHPTQPKEPIGSGLVTPKQEAARPPAGPREVPAVSEPHIERQLEYGGSSPAPAPAPVEAPPEDKPGPKSVARPKPAMKIESPHGGAGTEGYLEPDEAEPEDVEPGVGGVGPDVSDADMLTEPTDPDEIARIEREQLEARIRFEVEAEYEATHPGKKKAGKTPVKKPSSGYRPKGVKRSDVPMARMKQMPKCLVELAQRAFPNAERQDDAVAAYIYFREGMPADLLVPDEIAELARQYTGETLTLESVRDIIERDVRALQAQNRELALKMGAVELAAAYAVFEALSFRRSDADEPAGVDFLEVGMADLMKRLEAQAELKRMRDVQRAGRPFK